MKINIANTTKDTVRDYKYENKGEKYDQRHY